MIVAFLLILILAPITFAMLNRERVSLAVIGINLGLFCSMIGFFMIFAKTGGLPDQIRTLFFINRKIEFKVAGIPLSFDDVTRLLVAGRIIFVASLTWFTVAFHNERRYTEKRNYVIFASFVILQNILCYWPEINILNLRYNHTIATLTRLLLLAFLLVTIYAFGSSYRRRSLAWVKMLAGNAILMVISVSIQFAIFGLLGPLHLSDHTGYSYLLTNLFIYTPVYSKLWWYLIIIICVIFSFVGIKAVARFFSVQNQIGGPDISIEKKMKHNDTGVKIFTHGIKNQLIIQKVLIRKAKASLEEENYAEVQTLLEELYDETSHILFRVEEMYKVFKSNAVEMKALSIADVLDQSIARMKKGQEYIEKDYPEKALYVLADKSQLTEVFYNILINAVDAVSAKTKTAGKIEIKVGKYNGRVAVTIADNGVGIPEENLRKIFEPFYTDKNTDTSWGLGLSYAQKIIKSHYGTIRLDSTVGKGSTFYVMLPEFYPGRKENTSGT